MHLDNDQAVVSGCGGLAVADVCIIIPIILISLLIISRINFVASSSILLSLDLLSPQCSLLFKHNFSLLRANDQIIQGN